MLDLHNEKSDPGPAISGQALENRWIQDTNASMHQIFSLSFLRRTSLRRQRQTPRSFWVELSKFCACYRTEDG